MEGTAGAVPHLTRALPALAQVNGKVEGVPLLDHLAELLRDPDGEVRGAAAGAVGKAMSAGVRLFRKRIWSLEVRWATELAEDP